MSDSEETAVPQPLPASAHVIVNHVKVLRARFEVPGRRPLVRTRRLIDLLWPDWAARA